MEIEYKWDLQAAEGSRLALDAAEGIAPYVKGVRGISMHATYYDTPDGLVASMRGGLRLRKENDDSVCCLKLERRDEDGCAVRQEYEVSADDIRAGIAALPSTGAPADVCEQLLASELEVLCETQFERRAFTLEVAGDTPDGADAFSAELAFDEGALRRQGREQGLREMELEYKSGSLEAFHAFAEGLQDKLGLEPQPLSKLARAMRV